eukprot:488108_1
MSNEDFNDLIIQIKQCEKKSDVLKILHNILQTKHISNIQYKELTQALADKPVNKYNKIEYKPQNTLQKLQPLQQQSQFEKQHIQPQTQLHSQLKTAANTNRIDIDVNNTKYNDDKNVVEIDSKNNTVTDNKGNDNNDANYKQTTHTNCIMNVINNNNDNNASSSNDNNEDNEYVVYDGHSYSFRDIKELQQQKK